METGVHDQNMKPIVFISYSHKDEQDPRLYASSQQWLTYVTSFLRPAAVHGKLQIWDDRRIDAGGDWRKDIEVALSHCAVCVLLVSVHSLSSDFILNVEMKKMLERHYKEGVRLFPIVITSIDLDAAPWLKNLNLRPRDGNALELYDGPRRNLIMAEIAKEIREIIEQASQCRIRNETEPDESNVTDPAREQHDRLSTVPPGPSNPASLTVSQTIPAVPRRPIVEIYSSTTALDWFKEISEVFERRAFLSSQLLYAAPGGAALWRKMSEGNSKAYSDLKKAFLKKYKKIVEKFSSDPINIIDLGIGDFKKGQLILESYLDDPAVSKLNYFAFDASYDMLKLAFASSAASANNVIGRVQEVGRVLGIQAGFSDLRHFNHLFSKSGGNIFLFLGNTLGNQLREEQTLSYLFHGMNKNDILITELQLIEPTPFSTEELTSSIQNTKFFYASPFTTLGCRLPDVKAWVEEYKSSSHSGRSTTYNIYCRLQEATWIDHPLLESRLWIPNDKVLVYIVKKYKEETVKPLFERAGFEVIDQTSTEWKTNDDRIYHYIVARKPA